MSEELPERRMSKSSLCSLILGLLVCVPIVTGALAVVFGIVGLVRTRPANVTGRWMAIVGMALGLMSATAWGFQGSVIAGTVMVTTGLRPDPSGAAHQYLAAVANRDDVAAAALSHEIREHDATLFAAFVRNQGTFIDTNFTGKSLKWRTAFLEGTANFTNGTSQVKVDLVREGDTWKVHQMQITNAR